MKKSILLCFLLFVINSYGQLGLDQALFVQKPLDSTRLTLHKRVEFLDWVDKHKPLLDTCTTGRSTMLKAHKIASVLFTLDQPVDSVINYLEIAQKAAPFRTCRMLLDLEKKRGDEGDQFLGREYFAREVSEEWWMNFASECYSKYSLEELAVKPKIAVSKKEIIQNQPYADALTLMFQRDQQHRKKVTIYQPFEKDKQWALDTINRRQLDSLYQLYGFPSSEQVGTKGYNTAWYLLQHSPNCDWNKKWIEIFIEEYLKYGTLPSYMVFTMQRFFNPTSGYCDKEQSIAFISYLKAKYSEEVAEKFGYKDYVVEDK